VKKYLCIGNTVIDLKTTLDKAWKFTIEDEPLRVVIQFTDGAQTAILDGLEASAFMEILGTQLVTKNIEMDVSSHPLKRFINTTAATPKKEPASA
jgi:hypothetical protein